MQPRRSADNHDRPKVLILAIHPQPAEKILNGEKKYELRTRFPSVDVGVRVYLYVTAPVSAVVGGFMIGGVEEDKVPSIWSRIGSLLGITKHEFDEYARGRNTAKAIRVESPFAYLTPFQNKN